MQKYCFGIDVGGTTVKCGLFRTAQDTRQADGRAPELVAKWQIPTRTEDAGAHVLPDIAETMEEAIKSRWIEPSQVIGIGMGVPGPVLPGGIVNHCVNLGWGVIPAADELSKLFHGVSVRVANDANLAALGEFTFGSGAEYDSLIMLTLGTGLGCGTILQGRILGGHHGSAGEFGHAPLYPQATSACHCGKKGCLEQIASATGIVHRAEELLAEQKAAGHGSASVLQQRETITAKDVMDACAAGDPLANQVVSEMTDALGRGMGCLAATIDPEVFVIGGGVSHAGQWLIDRIREHFCEHSFFAFRETKVVAASLGNDAGIYGAAALFM